MRKSLRPVFFVAGLGVLALVAVSSVIESPQSGPAVGSASVPVTTGSERPRSLLAHSLSREGMQRSVLPERPTAASKLDAAPRATQAGGACSWNTPSPVRQALPVTASPADADAVTAAPAPSKASRSHASAESTWSASMPSTAAGPGWEHAPQAQPSREETRGPVPVLAAPAAGASEDDDASRSRTTGEDAPAFLEDAEFWEALLAGDEDDLQAYLDGLGFGDHDAERILESYEDGLVEVPEWFLKEKGLLTDSQDGPVFEAMWEQLTGGWATGIWRGGW